VAKTFSGIIWRLAMDVDSDTTVGTAGPTDGVFIDGTHFE
jgi:hypothetical protein